MSYYKLSEEDTKRIEITPTIVEKGWDNKTQIRQEFSFTKGRIMVRGKEVKRGEPKRADYVLFYKPNLPLAIVEAKSGYKTVSAGIQQGIDYAQTLNSSKLDDDTKDRLVTFIRFCEDIKKEDAKSLIRYITHVIE